MQGQGHLRWSRFKNEEAEVMHKLVGEEVFPFLRRRGGDGSYLRRQHEGCALHDPDTGTAEQGG